MAEPIPMARPQRVEHIDTPPEVREAASALSVRASKIAGILRTPAALPNMRQKAKDDLIAVIGEAAALWQKL
jgi:hypothetical protein